MKYIINYIKCFDKCLKYCELVELNVNIFVVDHEVLLTLIPFIFSSCVGICDVNT